MPIGLITDLAIGTDPRGSHAWSRQNDILAGVSVGAPPDLYQALGQDWGLTAMSPRALQETNYAAFIETLRAARSEEHTSELQSLMRNSYAVFCLKKKKQNTNKNNNR